MLKLVNLNLLGNPKITNDISTNSTYSLFFIFKGSINCLKTNFQCTTSASQSNINLDYSSNENLSNTRTLQLDCKNDLIYIVWSHYGHQNSRDNELKNR
jgi:hypothetical protein